MLNGCGGNENTLAYELEGYLHLFDFKYKKQQKQLQIDIIGGFSWAATQWEDVSSFGKRCILNPQWKTGYCRNHVVIFFTIPVEFGGFKKYNGNCQCRR